MCHSRSFNGHFQVVADSFPTSPTMKWEQVHYVLQVLVLEPSQWFYQQVFRHLAPIHTRSAHLDVQNRDSLRPRPRWVNHVERNKHFYHESFLSFPIRGIWVEQSGTACGGQMVLFSCKIHGIGSRGLVESRLLYEYSTTMYNCTWRPRCLARHDSWDSWPLWKPKTWRYYSIRTVLSGTMY